MPDDGIQRFIEEPDRFVGVRALFNADLATVYPEWAPRGDWVVIDRNTIEHIRPAGQR